jgi:DNA recombination protein RmuC
MLIQNILITCVVALVFAALGYAIARARLLSTSARLQTEFDLQSNQLSNLEQSSQQTRYALEHANADLAQLRTQLALAEQSSQSCRDQLAACTSTLSERAEQLKQSDSEKQTSEKALAATHAQLKESVQQITLLREEIVAVKAESQQERAAAQQAEKARAAVAEKLASVESEISAKEKHFLEQVTLLNENKVALKQEFQNLANEIFESKGKALNDQNRQSINDLLAPFKNDVSNFKEKVEHLHLEGAKQQAELRTELKQLQGMHQQMSQEAHNLATALKGQKKVQGNWGELVLENVLDNSGLRLGIDYRREVSLLNDEGNRSRPDVIVNLPQNKHLVIDAKVSLNAYTRYVNAENDPERVQALKEHCHAIAARIKELADRNYFKLAGINSPEMVVIFIPIESAFVEALKGDESLFQSAINQNVLVATPTTLLTSLNIVRQLWRFENQNQHTAELARKAEGVFKKLRTFLASFEGIKKGLEAAQKSYGMAEKQLVDGPGNLVKLVGDFKELAPAIKDHLPEYYTQKAELEIEKSEDDVLVEMHIDAEVVA